MQEETAIKYSVAPKAEGQAGFWRAFRPVVIGSTQEEGPVRFCPHNAISHGKTRLVIDYSRCDGCLICVRESHSGAIKEEREE